MDHEQWVEFEQVEMEGRTVSVEQQLQTLVPKGDRQVM